GDPLPDRPHRMARILESPEMPSPVDLEHLRALVPPPAAAAAPPSRPAKSFSPPSGDFFAQVNSAAMRALSAWVPNLFPAATPYRDGYRVTSEALGRDLEEALSILPAGIKDFGVHDIGDSKNGRRTPIDLVIEHGRQPDAKAAARWLCAALSIDPTQLGWRESEPAPQQTKRDEEASRAREGVSFNPTYSSSSAQSDSYSVILENQTVTFSTINKICLESEKEEELPADSIAAKRIAEVLKGSLAFNRDAMSWHLFTKTHWQPVEASVAEELVTKVLYDAVPGGFELRYLTAILKLLVKGLLPLPQPDAKAAGWIPFENGILEPATRTLHKVTPENAMTWCLPYDHDSAATCPTISKWLLTAVDGDEKTREFLRAWLAAVLEGRPDLQKFLHLLGPGGSGKGTFIRLAESLIGTRNATITDLRNLETNRFETAGLYGKRLVAITDSGNYRGGVDVLKALTGQDRIRLERKHQQQAGTFVFGGSVILASNEGMQTTDYTSGLERRRLTVEFNRVATAADRAAWDAQGGETMVLHREIPGLVNWVLGLSREETTRLIMNPPSRAAASNLDALRFGNPVADWLMESILPKPDHKARVGDKRQALRNGQVIFDYAEEWLYPNFLTWCARNARKDVSLVRFSPLIIDVAQHLGLQLKKDRDSTGRYIVGLILRKDLEKQHNWTRSKNDESSKPDDGLNDGLSPDNPLNMLTVTEYDNDSNLCTSAPARSNTHADNEDNTEVF
ncbi:MAG: phage/plasmid primase, P4 family, partial [Candidatus Competibacter sp.]